jgi:hypothetical protein
MTFSSKIFPGIDRKRCVYFEVCKKNRKGNYLFEEGGFGII